MAKYPNIWTLEGLTRSVRECSTQIDGKYMPARPLGFATIGSRIRLAAMVFTGRADALIWPGGQ